MSLGESIIVLPFIAVLGAWFGWSLRGWLGRWARKNAPKNDLRQLDDTEKVLLFLAVAQNGEPRNKRTVRLLFDWNQKRVDAAVEQCSEAGLLTVTEEESEHSEPAVRTIHDILDAEEIG